MLGCYRMYAWLQATLSSFSFFNIWICAEQCQEASFVKYMLVVIWVLCSNYLIYWHQQLFTVICTWTMLEMIRKTERFAWQLYFLSIKYAYLSCIQITSMVTKWSITPVSANGLKLVTATVRKFKVSKYYIWAPWGKTKFTLP